MVASASWARPTTPEGTSETKELDIIVASARRKFGTKTCEGEDGEDDEAATVTVSVDMYPLAVDPSPNPVDHFVVTFLYDEEWEG